MRMLAGAGLLLLSLNMFVLPLPEGMSRNEERLALAATPGEPELKPLMFKCQAGSDCADCVAFTHCDPNPVPQRDSNGNIIDWKCICHGGDDGCEQQNPTQLCKSFCTSEIWLCSSYGGGGDAGCGKMEIRQYQIDQNNQCQPDPCQQLAAKCGECNDMQVF